MPTPPIPRSVDRGPIEAQQASADSDTHRRTFRDQLIAAPLKPLQTEDGGAHPGAFRDQLIAAPLKRQTMYMAHTGALTFRDQLIAAPLKHCGDAVGVSLLSRISAIN